MTTAEKLLGVVVVAIVGAVAFKATTRGAATAARPTAIAGDSIYKVPMALTAAERMRRAEARAAQVKGQLAAQGSLTYMNEVLTENDSTVRHWSARNGEPIRIWVQATPGVPDFRPGFPALVDQALAAWSAVDGMPVRFTPATDSASAHVVVVFTARLDGNRIGLTRIEAINDTIRTGRITIATQRDGNVALRDADIARCALHEVGHLLGLAHTTDLASIMAPESAQPQLSPRDRATVALLYALPIGSIKAGASR